MPELRAGIDLGGTKIEVIVLDASEEVFRQRASTPSTSYVNILQALFDLHQAAKVALAVSDLKLGIAMPGSFTDDGLVKNANTCCLNGQPFQKDLEMLLGQPVAVMNDANLFALSEAVDGAAANASVVFGLILGTGVGGGLIINKNIVQGVNRIAGEWGHNALSAGSPVSSRLPRPCYCGLTNCVETYLSGAGLLQTYLELKREDAEAEALSVEMLVDLEVKGDVAAKKALQLYSLQVAAAVATVINIVDPDVIVLGGGLSNLAHLAERVQSQLLPFVFSDTIKTAVVSNKFGDSSGVRGAAWLCD